jgi:putative lipoprotein
MAKEAQGFAGCNQYFGAYTLKDDTLTFGPLGSTQMYCENADRETAFLAALQNTASYAIERQTLTLFDPKGQVVMMLVAGK